ncbi:MAG: DNA cytosine methyltransferase, partial [Bacteroidia bacterium]
MKNQSKQQQSNVASKGKKKKLTLEQRLTFQDLAVKLVFNSLFSGCGGSSKGYELANMLELLAVEWDENARESFSLNFPDVPLKGWDISQLTGKQILDTIGLQPGELDVFDGSPPCQGISTANRSRNPFDARNSLYLKTIKLINEVQPKVFVIENVSGLVKGSMKGFFNLVVDELKKLDYYCQYQVLRANEYGVPQARERCYIIGLRGDIYRKVGKLPLFPEPDLETAKRMRVCDVLPHIQAFSPGQFQDRITSSTRPFCTITKTASAWVYDENGLRRKPTIAELKVLSSFPKDFKLVGSFNQQWARIGNAVPPNLAKA